ncbi:MAG: hypothetical protein K9I95_14580, partial [Flavobacteriaceae bacterium]|nr:hypothetical protein [Flavobacteriaceae bacterium]
MALTLGSSFGFQSTTTSGGGGGNSVIVKDEGVTLTSALASLNFVGAGVTASTIGNDVTVTINGSSGTVTSVGLTMPPAFGVSNTPITSSGNIGVTALGLSSQYIRGDGQLANFPISSGGGASVSYYLNGSISQGTIDGVAYKEMNGTPIIGIGTDFTINADGYISQFITDVGDPNQLSIPSGNWNFETYFSASSSGGNPSFYIELYKYDGVTFTLISSNSSNPELITGGTSIDLYLTALAVPPTVLLATDRLAVRFYVIHSGRTITMHTENSHLSQIITTFSTGLTALNGLTDQVQYFAIGTSGTSFGISSSGDTHTFNLPTASSLNSGALSNTDWTTFNNKGNGDLKADGTIPLTANWNVGAYEITANKFIGNNGFGFNVGLGGSLVSASTIGTAKTWTLPNTTGTIALTSDIPSVSGFLKADGSVPLTANWNVGAFEITANKFIGNNGFGFNVGLGGSLVSASTTVTAKTWTLPNITGTIALLESPAFTGYPTTSSPPTLFDSSSIIPNTAWI